MKTSYLALLFCLLAAITQAQGVDFNQYFDEGSLRVDFFLQGTATEQKVSLHQLKKEPYFGGGTSAQLIHPDLGNYRVRVKDKTSGQVIFSKGFNPIFQEWQATKEAQQSYSTFENTMQLPFPKEKIVLEIDYRDKKGEFTTLYSKEIDPKHYSIVKEQTTPYPVTPLYTNGNPKTSVDLAIVAEGYTLGEMEQFLADAKRLTAYLFTIPPFNEHKKRFNVYAIQSPSLESGTDVGGEGVYKNTLLDSKFYTFDEPRYLTTFSLFKLADVTANVPYDQIYVLVNTKKYGGGGFYNVMNLVSAHHELSDKVFVHEFGHGFVGLADEYYDTTAGGTDYYPLNVEPWEKNITTLVDFNKKWPHKIKKSTPVPTPRTKEFENVVGVFEGGGYTEKGVYSPVQDCRMKSNKPDGFCSVCSDEIDNMINFYTK